MPQDGSMNYQYPPGTPGIPDTTIESESYNTFLDDLVVNDLNIARPIHRGGTGAVNAHDAMVNLKGEIATQIVTNYDSHPFVPGSFTSTPGATSAPTGDGYAGICYSATDTNFMTIDATSFAAPPITYRRQKLAGVWGAWTQQPGSSADLDAKYVNVTGDTMSGPLAVTYAAPQIFLNKTAGTNFNMLVGTVAGAARWSIQLGDAIAETGSNIGSNFKISSYNDAGGALGDRLTIDRQTGASTFTGNLTATGNINAANLTAASISSATNFQVSGSPNFGVYASGAIRYFQFGVGIHVIYAADGHIYLSNNNVNSFRVQGDGNILMVGSSLPYRPGGGPWLDSSDQRIKNVIGDYPRGLDDVAQLHPVHYTFKGNDTTEAPSGFDIASGKQTTSKDAPTVPYPNSPHYTVATENTQFAGLIAQEVEAVMPEMVKPRSGYIDGAAVTDMRDLDTTPLIFALVNAIKELKTRIEALEATP